MDSTSSRSVLWRKVGTSPFYEFEETAFKYAHMALRGVAFYPEVYRKSRKCFDFELEFNTDLEVARLVCKKNNSTVTFSLYWPWPDNFDLDKFSIETF